jgi:hypothetical protein
MSDAARCSRVLERSGSERRMEIKDNRQSRLVMPLTIPVVTDARRSVPRTYVSAL